MAKPEFITMARAALNYTKKRSTWEVFLRGYASTNQRGSATERDILEGLWKNFPTPDALRVACDEGVPPDYKPLKEKGARLPRWDRDNPKVGSGLQNLRNPTQSAGNLCKVPDLWPKLEKLLRCPDEESQALVKDFRLKPAEGNANKQIAGMKVGLATKGADMTMLWGGCEVPVIDLWMLRFLTPQVKELGGQTWGQLVSGYLKEMRKEGFDLDLKTPGAPKEFSQIVPAAEIDEYNPAHVQAGNGFVQSYIQGTGNLYRIYRDAAYELAEKEGLPANVWHVATWIELIESQKYDKDGNEISINRDDYDVWLNNPGDTDVKADKQTVRKSRDFLNTLRIPLPEPYGPSAYRDEAPGTPEWFKEQISLVMRGQTGQSLSTEQALNMLRQIRSEAGAYSDVVELIDQHVDSLEEFGDEPSRHEMSWQEALMKAQRWAKSHDSKDAKWAEGLIGSMMAGDLGPHLEDLQSLGFSTGREDMIRRQLKLILSHLDEWDGREAMESVDVLMGTAYPQLNPEHSFTDLSGLSRYAADIQMLVS